MECEHIGCPASAEFDVVWRCPHVGDEECATGKLSSDSFCADHAVQMVAYHSNEADPDVTCRYAGDTITLYALGRLN